MSQRKSYYIKQTHDPMKFKLAFAWLISKTVENGYLAIPYKANLELVDQYISPALGRALRKNNYVLMENKKIQLITKRGKIWAANNSPILAIYPDKDFLDILDSIPYVSELLVVSYTDNEVDQWVKTWNATELGKETNENDSSLISNKVVKAALLDLISSINTSTGISHPSDRDTAIYTFKVLLKHGELYDPDEVKSFLIKSGLSAIYAEDIRVIAQKVLDGRQLKIRRKQNTDNWIKFWREDTH